MGFGVLTRVKVGTKKVLL